MDYSMIKGFMVFVFCFLGFFLRNKKFPTIALTAQEFCWGLNKETQTQISLWKLQLVSSLTDFSGNVH